MVNTDRLVSLINQALNAAGSDFALSGARGMLMSALKEVEHVNKKRVRRENNIKQEAEKKEKLIFSAQEARKRIAMLDNMFKTEEAKLNNGLNQSSSPKN